MPPAPPSSKLPGLQLPGDERRGGCPPDWRHPQIVSLKFPRIVSLIGHIVPQHSDRLRAASLSTPFSALSGSRRDNGVPPRQLLTACCSPSFRTAGRQVSVRSDPAKGYQQLQRNPPLGLSTGVPIGRLSLPVDWDVVLPSTYL